MNGYGRLIRIAFAQQVQKRMFEKATTREDGEARGFCDRNQIRIFIQQPQTTAAPPVLARVAGDR